MSRTLRTTLSATFALALASAPAWAQGDPNDPNDPNDPADDEPGETDPDTIDPDEEPIEEPTPVVSEPADDYNEDDPYDQTDDTTWQPEPEPQPEPQQPQPQPQPEPDRTDTTVYAPSVTINTEEKEEEVIASPLGLSISLGGGVSDFADEAFDDVTDVGGAWDLRLAAGTRQFVGVELAYLGSAQDLHALGLDEDALLVSHGAEAGLRLNFANLSRTKIMGFQPYVASGVAVRRFSVNNESFNTSNIRGGDTVFEVPLGAGLGFRASQLMIDLRGAYRLSFDNELLEEDVEDAEDASAMDNWNVLLTGGFEF